MSKVLPSVQGQNLVSISVGNHRAAVLDRRNKLVEDHIHLVRPIAVWIHDTLPPSFDLDDLVGEGLTGLLRAAMRYRPRAHGGTPFAAFARQWIRGAILDSVRRGRYTANTRPALEAAAEPCIHPVVDIEIDQARMRARLEAAILALPPRLRAVIRAHYGARLVPILDIATKLGVTRESGSRLHSRALRALRALLDPAA